MDKTTRRTFMKRSSAAVGAAAGTTACMCALGGCAGKAPAAPKEAVTKRGDVLVLNLASTPTLAEVGGSALIEGHGTPILIARVEENQYAALSAKCTHFGQPVHYDPEAKNLRCASFGHSTFSLDGKVTKGPAKKPLTVFATVLEEGELRVTLEASARAGRDMDEATVSHS